MPFYIQGTFMPPKSAQERPAMLGVRRSIYIKEFDGLRGALAFWVFAFHAVAIAGLWEELPGTVAALLDGWQAVNVFIILSGFVITSLLLNAREGYGVFITRRFLRLWPTFAVCIFAALAVQALGLMPVQGEQLVTHIFVHATMLHSAMPEWLLPGSTGAILNPAWSISLEWQFYLLAPIVVQASKALAFRLVAASVFAFILYRIVSPMGGGFPWASLPCSAHLFWIGIVSAVAYKELLDRKTYMSNWPGICSLGAFFASAILLPGTSNVAILIWLFLFTVVLQFRFGTRNVLVDGVEAFLNSRILQWAGAFSYPLYLCHEIWIWPVQQLLQALGVSGVLLAAGNFVVAAPLVILSSVLLHRFVERPAIQLGKRLKSSPAIAAYS
jgi:peptidoglycan/LPS O-acetylase OafA/YrhL